LFDELTVELEAMIVALCKHTLLPLPTGASAYRLRALDSGHSANRPRPAITFKKGFLGSPPILAVSRELSVERAVEFRLLGKEPVQPRSRLRALATRHGAKSDLKPKFLSLVVKRNHRPLLLLKDRTGASCRAGPGQGRRRRRAAGRGGADFAGRR
jgi:hypothetical protein